MNILYVLCLFFRQLIFQMISWLGSSDCASGSLWISYLFKILLSLLLDVYLQYQMLRENDELKLLHINTMLNTIFNNMLGIIVFLFLLAWTFLVLVPIALLSNGVNQLPFIFFLANNSYLVFHFIKAILTSGKWILIVMLLEFPDDLWCWIHSFFFFPF